MCFWKHYKPFNDTVSLLCYNYEAKFFVYVVWHFILD